MARKVSQTEAVEIARLYTEEGLTLIEVGLAVGRPPVTVAVSLERSGIKRRKCGPKRTGGKMIDHEGYVGVVEHGDPMYEAMVEHRVHRGYVREHRLRMAQHLGRLLRPTETVHHKNGDRMDNSIDNLELRQGAHGPGAALVCACCGSKDLVPL